MFISYLNPQAEIITETLNKIKKECKLLILRRDVMITLLFSSFFPCVPLRKQAHDCAVEYATPLLTLYRMSQERSAGFGERERRQQVLLFYRTLRDILDQSMECRNRYRLILLKGGGNSQKCMQTSNCDRRTDGDLTGIISIINRCYFYETLWDVANTNSDSNSLSFQGILCNKPTQSSV